MSNSVLEDQLAPIISRGQLCIQEDLWFTSTAENEEPFWKTFLLIFIVVRYAWKLLSVFCSNSQLGGTEDQIRDRYKKLPSAVTSIYPFEKLVEAHSYKKGLNNIDIVFFLLLFVFDFSVILLDVPAFIWYGWLSVFESDGTCDKDFGPYSQLGIGVLWYLSLKGIRELWTKPIRYYEMTYDRKKGLADSTCCQWAIQSIL